MNIFEYAMKMEQDGRQYYLDMAEQTDSAQLKGILQQLADDELKHYNIFKAMKEGRTTEYKDTEKTTILSSVKNVFERLKSEGDGFSFSPDTRGVWEKAQQVEKDSEDFYREKAEEVGDDSQKHILNRIADEEHKHWVTIENVIRFLDRPQQWLEDAEWNHLEDY
jgi:rubrerythrin